MSDLEITPLGVTRRAKAETQVRILSYLAIPIKKKPPIRVFFFFILHIREKRTHEVSSTKSLHERSE